MPNLTAARGPFRPWPKRGKHDDLIKKGRELGRRAVYFYFDAYVP